jgi:hypothetical protein
LLWASDLPRSKSRAANGLPKGWLFYVEVAFLDAADHILSLPKAEQAKPHWQAAAEAVIMAAEDRGPMLHARVGLLRAMNHNLPSPVIPRKKAKPVRIIR